MHKPQEKRKPIDRPDHSRVETILTLAVFAVIIYVAVTYGPALVHRVHQSNAETARNDLTRIGNALQTYRMDVGSYPGTDDGLSALIASPHNDPNWHGPYLNWGPFDDPWGRRYVYHSPGRNASFDLLSYGADGEPGGQGDDADISYYRQGQ